MLTLFKIAARVKQYKDRVLLHLPGSCPVNGLLAQNTQFRLRVDHFTTSRKISVIRIYMLYFSITYGQAHGPTERQPTATPLFT